MRFYHLTFALVRSRRYLVLAQQSCYWPKGSDANSTVSCSSTGDSVCCQPGDVCLSNGLCYGPGQGTTYRSACTVRDWSNRTVCPIQYCPDWSQGQTMDLWKCQPASTKTFGTSQWWCGDPWITLPCTGDDTHFFNYTNGSFLGIALAASTSSLAVDTSAKTNTLPSSSSTSTSTNAATSAQDQPQPSKLPVALGAGIGSALGLVIIGSFLAFLYTRRTKSRDKSKCTSSSQESEPKVNVDRSPPTELRDTQRPHELGGNGRTEMPGTEARTVIPPAHCQSRNKPVRPGSWN